jgi:hypothetical protein
MTKAITYYEGSDRFDTYKIGIRNLVKVLVRKNFKPFKAIVFVRSSGKIVEPTHHV